MEGDMDNDCVPLLAPTCLLCNGYYDRKPTINENFSERENYHHNNYNEREFVGSGAREEEGRKFRNAFCTFWSWLSDNRNRSSSTQAFNENISNYINADESTNGFLPSKEQPCCNECFGALMEISRLEKIINETKAMQEEELKKLRVNISNSNLDNPHESSLKHFWHPFRASLIHCLGVEEQLNKKQKEDKNETFQHLHEIQGEEDSDNESDTELYQSNVRDLINTIIENESENGSENESENESLITTSEVFSMSSTVKNEVSNEDPATAEVEAIVVKQEEDLRTLRGRTIHRYQTVPVPVPFVFDFDHAIYQQNVSDLVTNNDNGAKKDVQVIDIPSTSISATNNEKQGSNQSKKLNYSNARKQIMSKVSQRPVIPKNASISTVATGCRSSSVSHCPIGNVRSLPLQTGSPQEESSKKRDISKIPPAAAVQLALPSLNQPYSNRIKPCSVVLKRIRLEDFPNLLIRKKISTPKFKKNSTVYKPKPTPSVSTTIISNKSLKPRHVDVLRKKEAERYNRLWRYLVPDKDFFRGIGLFGIPGPQTARRSRPFSSPSIVIPNKSDDIITTQSTTTTTIQSKPTLTDCEDQSNQMVLKPPRNIFHYPYHYTLVMNWSYPNPNKDFSSVLRDGYDDPNVHRKLNLSITGTKSLSSSTSPQSSFDKQEIKKYEGRSFTKYLKLESLSLARIILSSETFKALTYYLEAEKPPIKSLKLLLPLSEANATDNGGSWSRLLRFIRHAMIIDLELRLHHSCVGNGTRATDAGFFTGLSASYYLPSLINLTIQFSTTAEPFPKLDFSLLKNTPNLKVLSYEFRGKFRDVQLAKKLDAFDLHPIFEDSFSAERSSSRGSQRKTLSELGIRLDHLEEFHFEGGITMDALLIFRTWMPKLKILNVIMTSKLDRKTALTLWDNNVYIPPEKSYLKVLKLKNARKT